MCVNFDLHAANVWRIHNYQQEAFASFEALALEQAKRRMDELNRTRKVLQLQFGDKLSMHESRWRDLVSKNLSIRVAILTTRAETSELLQRTAEARRELARLDEA